MSVDPLVHETLEPYVYTGNNPVMLVDPDGRKKKDPVKLLKSAAKAGAKASKTYKDNYGVSAACNIAVRTAVHKYTGKDLLAPSIVGDGTDKGSYPGQANDMAQALASGKIEGFSEVTGTYEELQAMANEGRLIVAVADKSADGNSGHVVMLVPGETSKGNNCKSCGNTPAVMDGGYKGDFESTPMTTVSGRTTMSQMKFYIYDIKEDQEVLNPRIDPNNSVGDRWKPLYEGETATKDNARWKRNNGEFYLIRTSRDR